MSEALLVRPQNPVIVQLGHRSSAATQPRTPKPLFSEGCQREEFRLNANFLELDANIFRVRRRPSQRVERVKVYVRRDGFRVEQRWTNSKISR